MRTEKGTSKTNTAQLSDIILSLRDPTQLEHDPWGADIPDYEATSEGAGPVSGGDE